jgi:putative peptidoglycan lipid II flippase
MAPALLGLAVMQINTLADSLIAWGFAGATIGEPIGWLGGTISYPMQQGAAASTYFAQRLYQFPVGVLGIAVATVIFPLLAGHAAGGRARRLARDLTFGLRLVLFFAVPATAGLMILAEPIVRLVFEHGAFTPDDTARASRVVFWYASGIWAYCTLSVLLRGYYALGRHALPARIGMATVAIHLVLDFLLLWPMAEAGLALATSLAALWQSFFHAARRR